MEKVFESVIPSLVESGVFGDVKFVKLVTNDETGLGAQFGSSLSFVNLTVRGSSGEDVFPLVVKLPFSDLEMRETRDCQSMFHNELVMYREIFPGLQVDKNLYPRFYYGLASDGSDSDNDVIILENLKYKGFVLSKEKTFLDFDHIALAIKIIARFHSLSYILKNENINAFYELTKKLKIVTPFKSTEEDNRAFLLTAFKRGLKLLSKNGIDDNIAENFINCLKRPEDMKEFISTPKDPFSVICHGDFCNNNVLYRYDSNDKPIDCVFLDFQLSIYGSPALDLFFYLYMHTTADIRERYWDDILKLYWDTLRSSVPDHIDIPSFQEHLKYFASRAVYGYTICSWFLPVLIADDPVTIDEFKTMSLEQKISRFETMGGERCDILIGEVALHLFNKGYMHAFLELCKERNIKS